MHELLALGLFLLVLIALYYLGYVVLWIVEGTTTISWKVIARWDAFWVKAKILAQEKETARWKDNYDTHEETK